MARICVLSGAGLSAESGLGTFRDTDGLWTKYDLNAVATPEGYAANPALVHEFYNARRANMTAAEPNEAHLALARLSQRDDVLLVTQNIDNLLEKAGAAQVIHMHGELARALCHRCGHAWDAPAEMQTSDTCPKCTAQATRPDVVWFGEMPYHMDRIEIALSRCDLFVSIGTSGTVYPAAGFVAAAREQGAQTLELNLEPSEQATLFGQQRFGPASQIVPEWVDEVFAAN